MKKRNDLIRQIVSKSKEIYKAVNDFYDTDDVLVDEVIEAHIQEIKDEVSSFTDREVEMWHKKLNSIEV